MVHTEHSHTDRGKAGERPIQDHNDDIRRRLDLGRIALNGAIADPDIATALDRFGYDTDTLRHGLALLEEAERLVLNHRRRFSPEDDRSIEVHAAFERACREYRRAMIVARIAFKDDEEAYQLLSLGSPPGRGAADSIERARHFYRQLITRRDWLERMERYRYSHDQIESEARLVEVAADLFERAMARNTPEFLHALRRDACIDRFDEWLGDFRDISFLAMEDRPDLLEKLGYLLI